MNQRKAFAMSISDQLGLDVHDPVQIITRAWPGWVELEPDLAAVPDPPGLQAWVERDRLRACDQHWSAANQVLLGLARLGAVDGGDDPEAALVLAWLMLPTAAAVARLYQSEEPDIDAVVAGQLFIQTRTYPWRTRPGSVGKGIGRDLRRHVGHQVGIVPGRHLIAVDPTVLEGRPVLESGSEVDAEVEVRQLLHEAVRDGVIDLEQRQLLEDVMAQVEQAGGTSLRNRSLGGLTAPSVTGPVARRRAVTERTIRRRFARATTAIAEACAMWEVA